MYRTNVDNYVTKNVGVNSIGL